MLATESAPAPPEPAAEPFTGSVRIGSRTLNKARLVAKARGEKIGAYLTRLLLPSVNSDFACEFKKLAD